MHMKTLAVRSQRHLDQRLRQREHCGPVQIKNRYAIFDQRIKFLICFRAVLESDAIFLLFFKFELELLFHSRSLMCLLVDMRIRDYRRPIFGTGLAPLNIYMRNWLPAAAGYRMSLTS